MLDRLSILTDMPANIRAVIYDVDDCLAPESNAAIKQEWISHFVTEFGLTLEEAQTRNDELFAEYGCSATGFALAYGRPLSFVEDVYANTAKQSSARFIKHHKRSARLAEIFGIIDALGIKQMVFTQGHPDHYVPIIEHLGAAPYVPPYYRLDRLNTPPATLPKRGVAAWKHALHRLDVPAEQVLLLEDTPANIGPAASVGIHTAQIGSRNPGIHAASIHYRADTAEEILESLCAASAFA